jgi:hypothetical protein
VKEVTKLTMKSEIYPTKDCSRVATEVYLEHHHIDFYSKFSEAQWTGFYNTNIHPKVRFTYLNK